jgi:hypothetical protein
MAAAYYQIHRKCTIIDPHASIPFIACWAALISSDQEVRSAVAQISRQWHHQLGFPDASSRGERCVDEDHGEVHDGPNEFVVQPVETNDILTEIMHGTKSIRL